MDTYNQGKKDKDMVTPESPLLRRYMRYLFNNIYSEKFSHKQSFLLYLQTEYKLHADEIENFDLD